VRACIYVCVCVDWQWQENKLHQQIDLLRKQKQEAEAEVRRNEEELDQKSMSLLLAVLCCTNNRPFYKYVIYSMDCSGNFWRQASYMVSRIFNIINASNQISWIECHNFVIFSVTLSQTYLTNKQIKID